MDISLPLAQTTPPVGCLILELTRKLACTLMITSSVE